MVADQIAVMLGEAVDLEKNRKAQLAHEEYHMGVKYHLREEAKIPQTKCQLPA